MFTGEIKPLEWVEGPNGFGSQAVNPFGLTYRVWPDGPAWRTNAVGGLCADEAIAKAAAENDYENRILSSLQPSEAGESSNTTTQDEGVNALTEAKAAYGLLWRMRTADKRLHEARRALIEVIGKEGQKQGIDWARQAFGELPEPKWEELP